MNHVYLCSFFSSPNYEMFMTLSSNPNAAALGKTGGRSAVLELVYTVSHCFNVP